MFEEAEEKDATRAARYYGKYPGIVAGNEPPDNGGHRGEIVVEVPGILEEDREGKRQQPLRVMARPSFPPGFFFVPEKGDNVWVEFAAGDINQPIWTGVWYPRDKAPLTFDGNAPSKSQRVIRTVSGQVIQLEDTGDGEKIVILHSSGSGIEIAADGKITITDKGDDTSIVAKKISLGTRGGASEHLVLGETLKAKLDQLIQIVTRHVHPTGVGPSGPPASEAANLQQLSLSLKDILSSQNTTD